jgi:amidase
MSVSQLYDEQDGLGLAEHVRNGAVTATELLDEAIDRAARWNPLLNAIVIDDEAYGRRQIEVGLPDGPFRGVPFLLKNLVVQLKGTKTSNGSR